MAASTAITRSRPSPTPTQKVPPCLASYIIYNGAGGPWQVVPASTVVAPSPSPVVVPSPVVAPSPVVGATTVFAQFIMTGASNTYQRAAAKQRRTSGSGSNNIKSACGILC
jgi:hypothetical protein